MCACVRADGWAGRREQRAGTSEGRKGAACQDLLPQLVALAELVQFASVQARAARACACDCRNDTRPQGGAPALCQAGQRLVDRDFAQAIVEISHEHNVVELCAQALSARRGAPANAGTSLLQEAEVRIAQLITRLPPSASSGWQHATSTAYQF